jgi:hypothetical protein
MSDEPVEVSVPTSPELPADHDLIRTEKGFSGAMTLDLTDDQIQACMRIVKGVRNKRIGRWLSKFNDPQNFTLDEALKEVDAYEDELKYELADKVGVLVTVNAVPLLEGLPLQIEWLGVLPGGSLERYGQDHERKGWEVKRATERGEDYLGQHDG